MLMFVTAQKVSSATEQRIGINTFLYLHGANSPPGMIWDAPNLDLIDQFPGTLTTWSTMIAPGGNPVQSYLDVVCADGTEPERIVRALDQIERTWTIEHIGRVQRIDRIAMRFGCVFRLEVSSAQELRELREPLIKLVRDPSPAKALSTDPLRIDVSTDGGRRTFRWSDSAAQRLRSLHRPDWRPPTLSIDHAAQAEFAAMWGPEFEHVAVVLAGKPLEDLEAFGGVRFVDGVTGNVLWEWPRRTLQESYCLSCHQHRTLVQLPDGHWKCTFCGAEQADDGLWVAALT